MFQTGKWKQTTENLKLMCVRSHKTQSTERGTSTCYIGTVPKQHDDTE